MNKNLLNATLLLALLPLVACGQTTVTKHPAEAGQAASSSNTVSTNTTSSDVPDDLAQKLTEKLEKTYEGQKLKVQSVSSTPIAGLYEVVVSGNQIVYVDGSTNYMLVGDLLNVNTRESLTEARSADLNKLDFAKLPLDKAIKEVRGNGKNVVVVFSDPDCPFCKRLEHEFSTMTDLTIYNILMPITSLHPNADKKAVQLWCQPNRTQAWTKWMREGIVPPTVAECDNPVAETTSLGEQLGFNGTPTLVFPNGHVRSGYSPAAQLMETIKANQK